MVDRAVVFNGANLVCSLERRQKLTKGFFKVKKTDLPEKHFFAQ